MKKKLLATILLAGALVIAPMGGLFTSQIASASGNNTTTNSSASTSGTSTSTSGNNTVAKPSTGTSGTSASTSGNNTVTSPSGSSSSSGVNFAATVAGFTTKIAKAEENSTVVIGKESGINTLTKNLLKELAGKKNVSLKMEYTYKGKEYSIFIPAGKVILLDDVEYYGPLYLYALYGDMSAEKAESTYTVVAGDSLSRIAKKYNTTVAHLVSLNPQIKNADLIQIGQKINLQ